MSDNITTLHFDEHMLGDGVEFIGLITKNGRLSTGNGNNKFNLSKEQMDMFLISCSLQQRMQQDYDDNFGQVQFSVTDRVNFRIITVPQGSDTLIFVMDKSGEFLSGVQGLMDAIKHAQTL